MQLEGHEWRPYNCVLCTICSRTQHCEEQARVAAWRLHKHIHKIFWTYHEKQGYALQDKHCYKSYLWTRISHEGREWTVDYAYGEQERPCSRRKRNHAEIERVLYDHYRVWNRHQDKSVYATDLDMLITVQSLEDSPAVLSQGTIGKNIGNPHERKDQPLPTFTKDGTYSLQIGKFVPIVVLGVSVHTDRRQLRETESKIFQTGLQPVMEGLVEGESGSSGSGEAITKTFPPHIPARPSNKSDDTIYLFIFRGTPVVKNANAQESRGFHAEEVLQVEKTGYHEHKIWRCYYSGSQRSQWRERISITPSICGSCARQRFLPPGSKPDVIDTHNSFRFTKACEDLVWNHDKSTPHRSETNGITKGAFRGVKIRDFDFIGPIRIGCTKWWEATDCYCHLRKIKDLSEDGKTPYERRYDTPFRGPTVLLGA